MAVTNHPRAAGGDAAVQGTGDPLAAERFAAALTAAGAASSPAAGAPARSAALDPGIFLRFVTLGEMATGVPGNPGAMAASGLGGVLGGLNPAGLSPASLRGIGFGAAGDGAAGRVIEAATKYLGVPYRWGGTNPATGLDCSGFVQRVYADLGVSLPRVSVDQARQGTAVPGIEQARPGDLVFWRGSPNHIGIYAGDGQMIVAPRTGDVVKFQKITRTPHEIRRII